VPSTALTDSKAELEVAIKLLTDVLSNDPDYLSCFVREGRPNIPKPFVFWDGQGCGVASSKMTYPKCRLIWVSYCAILVSRCVVDRGNRLKLQLPNVDALDGNETANQPVPNTSGHIYIGRPMRHRGQRQFCSSGKADCLGL